MYDGVMKVSITNIILHKIGEAGEVTLNAFFPQKYSRAHLSRQLLGLDSYPKATPHTVASILSRLRREGLVERRGSNRTSSWVITDKGRNRLAKSNAQTQITIPSPDGVTRLVIFDVPERDRKKRNIIRTELVGCNFQQLQQSVWIGHNPLPEDFIELIDTLRLKNNVHIFSVKEKGTLE